MNIENIADVRARGEEPVVGQSYIVPCITNQAISETDCLPVHGTFHNDKEIIGLDEWHYHLDVCFLTAEEAESMLRCAVTEIEQYRPNDFLITRVLSFFPEKERNLRLMKRICQRKMYEFPANTDFITELEAAYQTTQLSECLLCPHKGFLLKGYPIQIEDGQRTIVCPGHGLKWNLDSGKLIPRTQST